MHNTRNYVALRKRVGVAVDVLQPDVVVAADAVPEVDVDLAPVEVIPQPLQPHHVAGTVGGRTQNKCKE